MAEHPRSARHVGVLHSAGILRARTSPSHGENRGSSPLGSANDFSSLAQKRAKVGPASPTFLQRTVLQTIGSRSRCDCRLEEAGSDLRHRRAGIGAKPTSVLKMPTLRIAALPRGAN